jgi:eukaryotic-like serine/threonine-protein kinase
VRGDQSEAVLDARTRCLDRRRDELAELARVLTDNPTGKEVDRAVDAASALYRLDTCTGTGVQTDVPLPNDPVRSTQIAALEKEIAAARAELLVARVDAATTHARSIVARAKPLGYVPLTARALRLLSNLAGYMSDRSEAERTINEAIEAAAAAHEDRDAADMWIVLMNFTATSKHDGAAALALAKPAEAALLRADSPANLRFAFHTAQGAAYGMLGKHREALAAYQTALREAPGRRQTAMAEASLCGVEQKLGHIKQGAELCNKGLAELEAELGPQHPVVGFALLNVGNAKLLAYDNKGAREVIERALAILKDSLGEHHITYANALNSLGLAASRSGDTATARSAYERSFAAYDAAHSQEAFLPLANLGNLDRDAGRAAEARKEWERALAIAEASQGSASERVAQANQALGNLDFDAGNLTGAATHYERALELTIALYGENHDQTAAMLDALANVYIARTDWKRATPYATRALAAYETVFDADNPRVAEAIALVGNCQTGLGDTAAIASLERALAIHDRHPDQDTYEPANTRWLLARALRRFHRDPARAIALAKEARALFAKSTVADAAGVIADIDRWLKRR